jgi:uncharacterized coiled-coil DUF342 family protein
MSNNINHILLYNTIKNKVSNNDISEEMINIDKYIININNDIIKTNKEIDNINKKINYFKEEIMNFNKIINEYNKTQNRSKLILDLKKNKYYDKIKDKNNNNKFDDNKPIYDFFHIFGRR